LSAFSPKFKSWEKPNGIENSKKRIRNKGAAVLITLFFVDFAKKLGAVDF
jgi:hypothetical protein